MKKLEVNLSYLSHNLSKIRQLIPSKCQICATIKADAYGHGLVKVAQQFVKSGVDYLGLTETKDAQILRDLGIKTPILLYLPLTENFEDIFSLDLIPFVSSLSYLKNLEAVVKTKKTTLKVHIKVDVGMGRFGALLDDSQSLIDYAIESPHLEFHGLCAHFSESEEHEKPETTLAQLARFETLRASLEKDGKLPTLVHIANSEGTINFPESHYDLVRPGAVLYGCSTSPNAPDLKPVMHLASEVVFVKQVPAGTAVSYNSIYTTKEAVQLCAVPLGYSDGLDMFLAEKGAKVYLNEKFYPIVGKVCMNTFLVEVPLSDSVAVGDLVEIVGENQSLIQWGVYYPSGSEYDAMCRLGCGQIKTYKYPTAL